MGGLTERIAAALDTARLADASPAAREEALLRGANLAAMDLGRKLEPWQADHLVAELPGAAVSECPNIRTGEVAIAMRRGAMGHFGPVYALSLAALVGFLRAHMASPERARAWAALLPERTAPTAAEMLERDGELLGGAFERWRRTGRYEDYGSYVHGAAERMGLLSLPAARRAECLQEGAKRAAAMERQYARRNGRARAERHIADALAVAPGTAGGAMALRHARQLELEAWFAGLEGEGTDIWELLGQRRACGKGGAA